MRLTITLDKAIPGSFFLWRGPDGQERTWHIIAGTNIIDAPEYTYLVEDDENYKWDPEEEKDMIGHIAVASVSMEDSISQLRQEYNTLVTEIHRLEDENKKLKGLLAERDSPGRKEPLGYVSITALADLLINGHTTLDISETKENARSMPLYTG